jgi:tetratricopeptide (TPR) repeat protein
MEQETQILTFDGSARICLKVDFERNGNARGFLMSKTVKRFSLSMAFVFLWLASGCTQIVLRVSSSSLIPNLTKSVFEECDLDLAEQSLPAELKLLEGLLKNDPGNRTILKSLSMGFTGYTALFVEDHDPKRASQLYLRARQYGLAALGAEGKWIGDDGGNPRVIRNQVAEFKKAQSEALFWISMSWYAWISLNLDKPAALGQMGIAEACLDRVLELDPAYLHGAPHILKGIMLAAKPKMLGGDLPEAKRYFENAIQISGGKFFMAQFYYARYYAVKTQDAERFRSLLREVIKGAPDGLKEACLINSSMREKAKRTLERFDEFFL